MKLKLGRRGYVIIAALLLGSLTVGFISQNEKDFQIAKNLDIFVTLFREVNLLYVDEKSPEELIEAGINGMLESLDPYTTYIPEEKTDDFQFMTTGKYGGIGALIRKAGDYSMVSEPYEGFPAQRAGLKAGDTLLSINGISTKGKSISQVSELLKGTPNTELIIEVSRINSDSTITKKLVREQVAIPNIPYYGIIKGNIGYILLNNFMKDAGKETKNAFEDLKAKGATSIILDLRGNPGGLLTEAVNVANIWVNKGQEIVSTRGKVKQWYKTYFTENNPSDTIIPIAVLVSRGSASASEIVAGAFQDLDRAIIIGERTFGKGLVQTTRNLSYNSHLKITTAKYYIPSGRCIQARDYSHRNEDGSVGYIPDSLISEFKTRNGRKVFDGGGIVPDIKIESDAPGNITIALYIQNIIFDYATYYAANNPNIAKANSFELTDDIYNDFLEFIKNKEFDYTTKSSEKYTELITTAKQEGYYDVVKDDLTAIEEKLKGNTDKDLQTFKSEIEELLKDEIVSRYYYQKGRVESGIQDDPEITKAIELLNSESVRNQILKGSYQGETIFAVRTH